MKENVNETLLEIKNLSVDLVAPQGRKTLLNRVDLTVKEKQIVALVGLSGSGKTTLGISILRLLPPVFQVTNGEIKFQGRDILPLLGEQMRRLRGKEIGMVFQEPLSALNPVFSVGFQIDEVLKYHTSLSTQKRQEKILHLLDLVGIKDSRRVARQYPHQLSGGMRQRVMIAQAIATDCRLIIADEPTSNLDVTVQARILELFGKLKEDLGISVLLITHDLGVVRELADEAAVLFEGRIVESGNVKDVLENPQHPFVRELVSSIGS